MLFLESFFFFLFLMSLLYSSIESDLPPIFVSDQIWNISTNLNFSQLEQGVDCSQTKSLEIPLGNAGKSLGWNSNTAPFTQPLQICAFISSIDKICSNSLMKLTIIFMDSTSGASVRFQAESKNLQSTFGQFCYSIGTCQIWDSLRRNGLTAPLESVSVSVGFEFNGIAAASEITFLNINGAAYWDSRSLSGTIPPPYQSGRFSYMIYTIHTSRCRNLTNRTTDTLEYERRPRRCIPHIMPLPDSQKARYSVFYFRFTGNQYPECISDPTDDSYIAMEMQIQQTQDNRTIHTDFLATWAYFG